MSNSLPTNILPWSEVRAIVGLGRSTVWRMVRKQTFPAPVQLTGGRVGWYESEVRAWAANRPRVKSPSLEAA